MVGHFSTEPNQTKLLYLLGNEALYQPLVDFDRHYRTNFPEAMFLNKFCLMRSNEPTFSTVNCRILGGLIEEAFLVYG